MLQYALLHLFGYKVTLDDLKAFRVKKSPFIIRFVRANMMTTRVSIVSPLAIQKLRILLGLK